MPESDRPVEENSYTGGAPLDPQQPPDDDTEDARQAMSRVTIEDDDDEEEVELVDDEDDDEDDDDEEEDFLSLLPPTIRARVEKLIDLDSQRDAILEEYLIERMALEQKWKKLIEPIYGERADIICGKLDGSIGSKESDAQIHAQHDDDEDEEEEYKGVPEFWYCAMSNIEEVSDLITDDDAECLRQLENITCDDFPDGKGFELKFYFADNVYFANKVLTKRYEIPNLMFLDDEPELKNVTGCEIDWKADKCLTHKEVVKKQRKKSGKGSGQTRTIVKKERSDSFFHFFTPPEIPGPDILARQDMNEEEIDAIDDAFTHDIEVAQTFRCHIVPKAVHWFTGDALDGGTMTIDE